uniref:NADH dehydrogenase subunit 4L n=1 Tax=Regioscalpellum regium TaxID=2977353 RepID=UPI0021CC954C|nr:NADH dehydrogenase subunit 4L [Regioscalpellum regium]UWM13005.1 NADH dehydrogenase subunit 4L [Regioscalpellum regium]
MIFLVPFLMIIFGLFVCVSNRKHLMSILISLEFMSLGLFFFIFLLSLISGSELYISLLFLVAAVCEGSLGISLMVNMVRSNGADYVFMLNLLGC